MDLDEDFEMRSEEAVGGVELSSVEINILVYLVSDCGLRMRVSLERRIAAPDDHAV